MTWQNDFSTAIKKQKKDAILDVLLANEFNPAFNHLLAIEVILQEAPEVQRKAFHVLHIHFISLCKTQQLEKKVVQDYLNAYLYHADVDSFKLCILHKESRCAIEASCNTRVELLLLAVIRHFEKRPLFQDGLDTGYLHKLAYMINLALVIFPERHFEQMSNHFVELFIKVIKREEWPMMNENLPLYEKFLERFRQMQDELFGRLAFSIEEPDFMLGCHDRIVWPVVMHAQKSFLRLIPVQAFLANDLRNSMNRFLDEEAYPSTAGEAIMHFHEHGFLVMPIYSTSTCNHIELLAFVEDYCIRIDRGVSAAPGISIYEMRKGENLESVIENYLFDNNSPRLLKINIWFETMSHMLDLNLLSFLPRKPQKSGN